MTDADKPAAPYAIAIEDVKPGVETVSEFTTGKWEVGLCGCCTHCVPNCLMTALCPCVTVAQISARLGMMSYGAALLLYILLVFCTGGAGALFVAVWIMIARKQTRERYQIPGGCFTDCLASCFCGCCAAAQVATHIKSYKPGNCAFGPQDTLAPYHRA